LHLFTWRHWQRTFCMPVNLMKDSSTVTSNRIQCPFHPNTVNVSVCLWDWILDDEHNVIIKINHFLTVKLLLGCTFDACFDACLPVCIVYWIRFSFHTHMQCTNLTDIFQVNLGLWVFTKTIFRQWLTVCHFPATNNATKYTRVS